MKPKYTGNLLHCKGKTKRRDRVTWGGGSGFLWSIIDVGFPREVSICKYWSSIRSSRLRLFEFAATVSHLLIVIVLHVCPGKVRALYVEATVLSLHSVLHDGTLRSRATVNDLSFLSPLGRLGQCHEKRVQCLYWKDPFQRFLYFFFVESRRTAEWRFKSFTVTTVL